MQIIPEAWLIRLNMVERTRSQGISAHSQSARPKPQSLTAFKSVKTNKQKKNKKKEEEGYIKEMIMNGDCVFKKKMFLLFNFSVMRKISEEAYDWS